MERDARLSKHTVLWRVAGDMLRLGTETAPGRGRFKHQQGAILSSHGGENERIVMQRPWACTKGPGPDRVPRRHLIWQHWQVSLFRAGTVTSGNTFQLLLAVRGNKAKGKKPQQHSPVKCAALHQCALHLHSPTAEERIESHHNLLAMECSDTVLDAEHNCKDSAKQS
eukprot:scaffold13145_cov21-Tisochrysis_lutea.AAC.1